MFTPHTTRWVSVVDVTTGFPPNKSIISLVYRLISIHFPRYAYKLRLKTTVRAEFCACLFGSCVRLSMTISANWEIITKTGMRTQFKKVKKR